MIGQVDAMAVPGRFRHADDRPPKIGYVPDVLDRGLAIHQSDIVCFASRDQIRQRLNPIANVGQQFASRDYACASASGRDTCVAPHGGGFRGSPSTALDRAWRRSSVPVLWPPLPPIDHLEFS